jgi:hypothetical protein
MACRKGFRIFPDWQHSVAGGFGREVDHESAVHVRHGQLIQAGVGDKAKRAEISGATE